MRSDRSHRSLGWKRFAFSEGYERCEHSFAQLFCSAMEALSTSTKLDRVVAPADGPRIHQTQQNGARRTIGGSILTHRDGIGRQ
jgi:hypothetical protein